MFYALQHPSRTIAVPLSALVLGLAGGASAAALLIDDTVEFRSPLPAAQVSAAPSSSAVPVPERVAPGPSIAPIAESGSPQPVPERVAPAPTAASAGTGPGSPSPTPERVSDHAR